jgi:YggT family protein
MIHLVDFIQDLIWLYILIVFAMAIMSWLMAFNVVNTQNRFVYTVADLLLRLTEPALGPIRRWLPNLGGIDISPIILFIILIFIRNVLLETIRDSLSASPPL